MTTKQVAQLSGVSVRTLHHYDEIGLLIPQRHPDNGYRNYTTNDLDILQQILFFRACGFSLSQIKEMLSNPEFSREKAFLLQRKHLMQEKQRITAIIKTLDQSIDALRGEYNMDNKEKFAAFKEKLVEENETKYGEELRENYGNEVIDASNAHLRSLPQEVLEKSTQLDEELLKILLKSDIKIEEKQMIAEKHKEWLQLMWGNNVPYTKEIHLQVADMYIADDRFSSHYGGKEKAILLRNILEEYL